MSGLNVKVDAISRSSRIQDGSGLIYLKFFCSILMIFYHSIFFTINVSGPLSTSNFVFELLRSSWVMGVFPLILPATAGGMLILRMSGSQPEMNRISRIPWSRSWGVLGYSVLLMGVGAAINFILYRNEGWYTPYFQSTLQFLSLTFVLLWLCLSTNFWSLFALALLAVILTAQYSHLRTTTDSTFIKVLFESDGARYLWPLFPWAGVVAFSAGLQWKKASWFRPDRRPLMMVLSLLIAILMVYSIGTPLSINSANLWSAGIFQPGGYHAVTIMALYTFFWLISCWLCERLPPRRFGLVHVFGQGILLVYVTNILLGRWLHNWFRENGQTECLALAHRGNYEPCLVKAFLGMNVLMYFACWLVAYVVCRYYFNARIRIRFKQKSA